MYFLVDITISTQTYNFTFNINEKLDSLNITLLINGSPIPVPYECQRKLNFQAIKMSQVYTVGIDENMCYCVFRIANMEIDVGQHSITFQAILNGEVRGSTTSQFFVTDSKFICAI